MQLKPEFKNLATLRKDIYRLDFPIFASLIGGVVSNEFFPLLAPIFGVLAFILFYKKMYRAAKQPCPHCNKPFGTQSKYVLGAGKTSCSNCEISMYE